MKINIKSSAYYNLCGKIHVKIDLIEKQLNVSKYNLSDLDLQLNRVIEKD